MALETRVTQLLNDSINFQTRDPVIHDSGTSLSQETLHEIKAKMAAKTFDVTDYPALSLMKSGQPHYRQLVDEDGNIIGKWFKFMCLDFEDVQRLGDQTIVELLEKLADHVRGEHDGEEWVRGFEKFAGLMTGNRDGALTAFTTGITLLDSYITSPVAHSTLFKNDNPEFMAWLQEFHSILGDLGGMVMRRILSPIYSQFTQDRHEHYNPPLFGSKTGSQTFFTSSQINRSRPSLALGGTAGGVHCDPTDCDISYSLSINLSVLRNSSDLGYFWFTDYDCLIPLKPMQICIFQGVEEHTGTPLITDPDDISPLPRGYTEETRFNIICYPKKPILNNTAQRNYGKQSNAPDRPNLFRDALYQLGGEENYNTWRARETFRLALPHIQDKLDYSGALTVDPVQCYNMFSFANPSTIPNNNCGGGSGGPSRSPSSNLTRPTPYNMPIEKTFESAEMDALIESLGSILRSNKHLPFRTVGRLIEATKLSGLLQQSSNIPQKRTAMHSLSDEDESSDEDEEPALYESTIDPESVLQQIDISSSDDEGPGHLPTAREVTVEELQQFHLFDKEHLTTELDKSLNWTIPAGSQHRFSMQDHLKQLIPALPPPTATGEGRSSSTIVEFSVVYASILGQLNWKQNQTQIVQAGILATFGRLTMEWLDQIENDFSDLFRLDDGALVLHPDSVGYRLKKRIDECLDSLTGHNDPTLVFHFDAEAIIGESFDENFHLNVELKPKFRHTNTTRLKAKAYRNVIWGMCLFWPLNVFVSMVRGVKPSLKSTVQLPLGSKTNHSYLNMVGWWRFLMSICKALSGDEHPTQSFMFMSKLYQFVFTFRGRHRLSKQVITQVTTLLQEDDRLSESRESIRGIAASYNRRFNLDLLLKNQGNKALESLLLAPSQQNQVAKRLKAAGTSKRVDGPATKKQRTRKGATIVPKPVPKISFIFPLTDTQLQQFTTTISTFSPIPQDTAPLLAMVQCMTNAFELTKLCLDRISRPDAVTPEQWKERVGRQTHGGVKAFMKAITCNTQGSDKLCAIRTRSPSFLQMSYLLRPDPANFSIANMDQMTVFVRQLMLFRAGFGMPRLIRFYASCTTLKDIIAAQQRYIQAESEIRPGLAHNPLHLSAYGELRIAPSRRDNCFTKILESVPEFAQFLMGFVENNTKPSFQTVKSKFTTFKIPYMRNNTLINWLLICDLAEFGLCEFPDIDSLITKIQEGGGTGPEMGLNIAFAHLENARAPPTDTDELKAFLNMLEKALDQTIGDEWEQLAGRRLNTNDTEHLLCKVKRIAKHLV